MFPISRRAVFYIKVTEFRSVVFLRAATRR